MLKANVVSFVGLNIMFMGILCNCRWSTSAFIFQEYATGKFPFTKHTQKNEKKKFVRQECEFEHNNVDI
jgi:hypothetical protein